MVYVKADVPDDVHKKIRVEAAEHDMPIEEVVRQDLIALYSE